MVLLDGNVVNINRLKKLNISRADKLFKVSVIVNAHTYNIVLMKHNVHIF